MLTASERKERILREVTIADVLDIKSGSRYVTCPECKKSNKFNIFASGQLAKCQSASCSFNKPKNLIECYKWKHNIDNYWDAIKSIEKEYNLEVNYQPGERTIFLEECLEIYVYYLWSDKGKEALAYLKGRGFNEAAIKSLKIGYAPHIMTLREYEVSTKLLKKEGLLSDEGQELYSNRIILPIRNVRGDLVHFTSRYIGVILKNANGEDLIPRYKESKTVKGTGGTKNYLAFENNLKDYRKQSDTLIVTEGYFDALSLIQKGLSAVGSFGLEKLTYHYSKFKNFSNIIFMFDNDTFDADHSNHPGEYKSWIRVLPQVIELQLILPQVNVYVCMVPTMTNEMRTKDINDWITKGKLRQEDVAAYIDNKKRELISNLISKWGDDLTKHNELLQLIKVTGRLEHLKELEKYIPNNLSLLEYGLQLLAC